MHDATLHKQEIDKRYLGFWIYLMTDCLLFASLFATYLVLRNNTFNGSAGKDIFDLPFVLTETIILLTSSFVCGLMMIYAKQGKSKVTSVLLSLVVSFGLIFLFMEIKEFSHLVANGNSWQASAFLSGYFTLVGTHGLHILVGLIWGAVMWFRIRGKKLNEKTIYQLGMFSLFWHFLDLIWIFIFTFVYLLGAT